jgi:hypothetical protein
VNAVKSVSKKIAVAKKASATSKAKAKTKVGAPPAARKPHKAQSVIPSGGSPGFEGYLYQRDVSVWVALDLVLWQGLADAVELEPLSHEDIEARLRPDDPGKLAVSARTPGKLLVIQVKHKSTGEWDVKAVQALLAHGGTTRISAQERLNDPDVHYLLVTNAPAIGVAANLAVTRFGEWPDLNRKMPAAVRKQLSVTAPGRVALLHTQTHDRIRIKIKELLFEWFHVPHEHWESCLVALGAAAESKMTGAFARTWNREEIDAVIQFFGGNLPGTSSDSYVKPLNWDELCQRLKTTHAVILSGPSGYGKTATASALGEHVRANASTAGKRVTIHTPSQARAEDNYRGTVVFDVEDPWGTYKLESGHEAWNDQIVQLLRDARADRIFIITTRQDIMESAEAQAATKRWRVPLGPDHYGQRERRRMYEHGIRKLPSHFQVLAGDSQEYVLSKLASPLEIARFFDELFLSEDDPSLPDRQRIDNAVKAANDNMIEKTVARHFSEKGSNHWAVVLWGLLRARPKLLRADVPRIEQRLANADARFEDGVGSILGFLIAGHNLRQVGGVISYAHPRVAAGLEGIIANTPLAASKIFRILIDAFVGLDPGSPDDWGRESAVRLLAGLKGVVEVSCSPQAHSAIDAWLTLALATAPDDRFEEYLRLAARAGSKACMPAELARLLVDDLPMRLSFRAKNRLADARERSMQWYAEVADDPVARSVCHAFVRVMLPSAIGTYDESAVDCLERIAGPMPPTFVQAALSALSYSIVGNDRAIAYGALRDIEGFERVIKAALDEWVRIDEGWAKHLLALTNDEYSEDHAAHLNDSAHDDAYCAGEFIEAYVRAVRAQRGWRFLSNHPDRARLFRWWLESALTQAPCAEEADFLLREGLGSRDEALLWQLVHVHWRPQFLPALLKRLGDGHSSEAVRSAGVFCLAEHAPNEFRTLSEGLVSAGRTLRLVSLFEDLNRSWRWGTDRAVVPAARALWLNQLSAPVRALVQPFCGAKASPAWDLPPEPIELIRNAPAVALDERAIKVRFGKANGFDVSVEIAALLSDETEVSDELALIGIDGAVAFKLDSLAEQALGHRYARVRAQALRYIAALHPGVLPERLRDLVRDPARYVREALLDILASRRDVEYLPELLVLMRDTWSPVDTHGYDPEEQPIARTAAKCLEEVTFSDDKTIQEVYDAGLKTHDQVVRQTLLKIVANKGPESARQNLLMLAIAEDTPATLASDASGALRQWSGESSRPLHPGIQPGQLLTLPPSIAAELVIMAGFCGPERLIDDAASRLAGNAARRVFLVLLALAVVKRFPGMLDRVTGNLPQDHPVVALLLGKTIGMLDASALDNLGDGRCVREVVLLVPGMFTGGDPSGER